MLTQEKLDNLTYCLEQIKENNTPGAIIECGIFQGGSLKHIVDTMETLDLNRYVHGFDTFEGLPKPTKHDFKRGQKSADSRCKCSLEQVQENLKDLHIQPTLHKGPVEQTLSQFQPIPIALLHLDMDYYLPTKTALEYLYRFLNPKAFLVIDDYGCWMGCRKAVNEFFDTQRPPFLRKFRTTSQRIIQT